MIVQLINKKIDFAKPDISRSSHFKGTFIASASGLFSSDHLQNLLNFVILIHKIKIKLKKHNSTVKIYPQSNFHLVFSYC